MNALIILLVGLGMPAYYKIKFLILGIVQIKDIFNWTIFAEIFFGVSLAIIVLVAHGKLVTILRNYFYKETQIISIQLIATSFLSIIVAILYSILFWDFVMKIPITQEYLFDYAILGLFIPILVNGVTETFYYYSKWEKEKVIKLEIEKEQIKAKYEALQNQIDPHFFFNCFNTLSVLIDENKKVALNFLQQLSKVYRYILEIKDNEVISLSKELDTLYTYINLMEYRFEDSFDIVNNIKNVEKNYLVAPLTLQILMENALKHNVFSKSKHLQIRIEIDSHSRLIFSNTKYKKTKVISTNTGLTNLINRYKYLIKEKIIISDSDDSFKVSIPLIKISPL